MAAQKHQGGRYLFFLFQAFFFGLVSYSAWTFFGPPGGKFQVQAGNQSRADGRVRKGSRMIADWSSEYTWASDSFVESPAEGY